MAQQGQLPSGEVELVRERALSFMPHNSEHTMEEKYKRNVSEAKPWLVLEGD